ncbi:hypothetical protein HT031_003405 [Scenedesmus sp. PABB004]|nr:hypothetical protein HT031_003405 [Scenedesmus sp. PABB004]
MSSTGGSPAGQTAAAAQERLTTLPRDTLEEELLIVQTHVPQLLEAQDAQIAELRAQLAAKEGELAALRAALGDAQRRSQGAAD